ncbi:sensor histidine kinase [Cellulomonas cellasea]|uniref:Oxygen sensor histidine kinase NreB n=1 Tax=Cellulomonas cellasea TaxID=43670 RepID=A0A7W4UE40_9CELL|nr:sensor histidine kinase [Cellulomonas cellasea]MBB2922513.1 signal transduction histidine kinase [Cellulomonas cellasea]
MTRADEPRAERSAAAPAGGDRPIGAHGALHRMGLLQPDATDPADQPPRRPAVERAQFWTRTLRGWDVAFYVMIAIACASFLFDGHDPAATTVSFGAMALLATAYTVIGRRAALRGDGRLAHAYLAVLVVVVVLVVRLEPMGTLLLFIAYSQIWFFCQRRTTAAAIALVLAVGASVAMGLRGWADRAQWVEIAGQMGIGLMFSVLLGLWITQIAEQSEERAGLIERLEAAQAALAATNHAAGVLAERERLAQEIHDTLAQGFTSVVMLAQAAGAELDRGAVDATRGRVEQIEDVARENLAEARALVAAFGPAGLQQQGLRDALTRLAERFSAETGVQVDVDLGQEAPLSRDTEVVLLRGAQEALANVRKHADARRVRLRLGADDGSVELEVHDDGRGMPPEVSRGVGLRGMHERVRAGGGTLDVGTAPGGGTRVLVRMPAAADGGGGGGAVGGGAVGGDAAGGPGVGGEGEGDTGAGSASAVAPTSRPGGAP